MVFFLVNVFLYLEVFLSGLLRGAGLSLFLRCSGAVASFVVTLLITKNLGAENSGVYFLAFSIVNVLGPLCALGLSPIITRDVATLLANNNWLEVNKLFSTCIIWVVFFGSLVVVSCLVFYESVMTIVFSNEMLWPVFSVMVFSALLLAINTVLASFFQGSKQIVMMMFFQNFGVSFLMVIFLSALVAVGLDLDPVIVGGLYSIATFIIASFGVYQWVRKDNFEVCTPRFFTFFDKEVFPSWGGQVVTLLMLWSPTILIGIWASLKDVSIFSTAFRVAMLLSFVLSAVSSVIAPDFARLYKQEKMSELEALVKKSILLLAVVCIPVLILLLKFGDAVMAFFGDEFTKGSIILNVLVFGQCINIVSAVSSILLTMSGYIKETFYACVISLFVLIILSCFFIPLMGGMGAAISYCVAILVQVVSNLYHVKKKIGFIPINVFVRA